MLVSETRATSSFWWGSRMLVGSVSLGFCYITTANDKSKRGQAKVALIIIGHSHTNTLGLSGYNEDKRSQWELDVVDNDYNALNGMYVSGGKFVEDWKWRAYSEEQGRYTYRPKFIMEIDPKGGIEKGGLGSREATKVLVPGFDPASQDMEKSKGVRFKQL